jgi:hypothetical protein
MRRLMLDVAESAGLETCELPQGVRRRDAGSAVFYFNYTIHTIPEDTLPHLDIALQPAGLAWTSQ